MPTNSRFSDPTDDKLESSGAYERGRQDAFRCVFEQTLKAWSNTPTATLASLLVESASDSLYETLKRDAISIGMSHLDSYLDGISTTLNEFRSIHIS